MRCTIFVYEAVLKLDWTALEYGYYRKNQQYSNWYRLTNLKLHEKFWLFKCWNSSSVGKKRFVKNCVKFWLHDDVMKLMSLRCELRHLTGMWMIILSSSSQKIGACSFTVLVNFYQRKQLHISEDSICHVICCAWVNQ